MLNVTTMSHMTSRLLFYVIKDYYISLCIFYCIHQNSFILIGINIQNLKQLVFILFITRSFIISIPTLYDMEDVIVRGDIE